MASNRRLKPASIPAIQPLQEQFPKTRLEYYGRLWQRRLRLQDWFITFQFLPREKMDAEGLVGQCSRNTQERRAVISLLDPKDYSDDFFLPDMEETLVHELLHCVFPHLRTLGMGDGEGDNSILTEQGVNTVAYTLVCLSRGLIP